MRATTIMISPSSVISIDRLMSQSCDKPAKSQTIHGVNAENQTRKGRFVMNLHTRKQFLALTLGPLDYSLEAAAKASHHDLRDGIEQIKALARRQYGRDMQIGRAA